MSFGTAILLLIAIYFTVRIAAKNGVTEALGEMKEMHYKEGQSDVCDEHLNANNIDIQVENAQ